MCNRRQWITPFTKQCFVTLGVSLNMMQHGLVMAFAAIFLSQLKKSKKIDDSLSSWIASINGFGLFFGILLTPVIMPRLSRKGINLLAAISMTLGWIIIYLASNAETIIAVRFFQGIVTGFTAFLCSVLIGEYTSPVYRGAFLNTITTALFLGIFVAHTAGSYLSWKNTALVSTVIGLVDIVIILYSPNSPTYLAMKGRYDDCKKVFRWLRGDEEEDELQKMIKMYEKSENVCYDKCTSLVKKIKRKINHIIVTLKKKAFYKPIFIMIHLHIINLWSGAVIYDSYAINIYNTVIGPNANIATVIISMDIQSLISNLLSILIVKRLKRKTLLLLTTLLNITAYVVLAGYVLAKTKGVLYFDHPLIGTILGHFHVFSFSVGPVSLPNIVVGEIFPAKYRGIGGTISILFFSICMAFTLKATPFLFTNIGLPGTFTIYAAFVAYGSIGTFVSMPETKDKTLQEIEQEFVNHDKGVVDKEIPLLNVTIRSEEPH